VAAGPSTVPAACDQSAAISPRACTNAARRNEPSRDVVAEEVWLPLADLERYHIEQTLHHTYYNQSAAARLLRISRRVLSRKVKLYGIDTSLGCRRQPTTGPAVS
jgi:DNA-binding NtrC family response regulator